MKLLTKAETKRLIKNGERSLADPHHDPKPVVKLFTPDAGATWLLSELDPESPDQAFGLCDLGLGFPELGWVNLAELRQLRGKLGLPVERDLRFRADKPISAYAEEARKHRRIT